MCCVLQILKLRDELHERVRIIKIQWRNRTTFMVDCVPSAKRGVRGLGLAIQTSSCQADILALPSRLGIAYGHDVYSPLPGISLSATPSIFREAAVNVSSYRGLSH